MAVVFPATPAPNQVVTDPVTNATWRWDAPSQRWVPAATGAAFLPLSGGTMTGDLILSGDATNPLGAVTLHQLQAASGNPQGGGRLTVQGSSPSNVIVYSPFNGDAIRINGVFFSLPVAGVVGNIANTFIDGVGGQALTPVTAYFVYIFNNAGTLTLDFSLIGHSTSITPGNVGVEIKTGDESRTLVGFVLTGDPPGAFFDTPTYRYIRSWLNRPIAIFTVSYLSGSEFPNGSYGLTSCNTQILSFAGEQLFYDISGSLNNISATSLYIQLYLDGGVVGASPGAYAATPGENINIAGSGALTLIEGNHVIGIAGFQGAGLTTAALTLSGIVG